MRRGWGRIFYDSQATRWAARRCQDGGEVEPAGSSAKSPATWDCMTYWVDLAAFLSAKIKGCGIIYEYTNGHEPMVSKRSFMFLGIIKYLGTAVHSFVLLGCILVSGVG